MGDARSQVSATIARRIPRDDANLCSAHDQGAEAASALRMDSERANGVIRRGALGSGRDDIAQAAAPQEVDDVSGVVGDDVIDSATVDACSDAPVEHDAQGAQGHRRGR
jgi:hypothetical protein